MIRLTIAVLLSLILGGCTAQSAPQTIAAQYNKISAEQAKEMMNNAPDYILLDVRTDEEFLQSHIEGAMLIPDFEITHRAKAELPDKDVLILIYCRSGRRSALSAQAMVELGYTNTYDFGGIIDWPYDTVSGE
jgi:Rhodanese-related sulfurtransferase